MPDVSVRGCMRISNLGRESNIIGKVTAIEYGEI